MNSLLHLVELRTWSFHSPILLTLLSPPSLYSSPPPPLPNSPGSVVKFNLPFHLRALSVSSGSSVCVGVWVCSCVSSALGLDGQAVCYPLFLPTLTAHLTFTNPPSVPRQQPRHANHQSQNYLSPAFSFCLTLSSSLSLSDKNTEILEDCRRVIHCCSLLF